MQDLALAQTHPGELAPAAYPAWQFVLGSVQYRRLFVTRA